MSSIRRKLDRLEAKAGPGPGDTAYWPILLVEVEGDWPEERKQAVVEAAYREQELRLGRPRPGPGTGVSAVVVELWRE